MLGAILGGLLVVGFFLVVAYDIYDGGRMKGDRYKGRGHL